MRIKTAYRPDIDGLRAIAVLSVLFFHAHIPGFSGGFVGVDIFFVISGYLITGHLYGELIRTGKISLASFYARRIKRLAPSLALVLFVSAITWFALFRFLRTDTDQFFRSLTASTWGIGNFFFYFHTGGYFDASSDRMPLLHLWSLGIEEQFYFLWPITLMLIFKMTRKSGRFLLPIVCGFCLASWALAYFLVSKGQSHEAFYLPLPRAWELGVGGILAICEAQKSDFRFAVFSKAILPYLGLFVSALSIGYLSSRHPFPGLFAVLPIAGAVMLIGAATASTQNRISRCLSFRPLVWIGLRSYPIYLWHWPILVLIRLESAEDRNIWLNCLGLVAVIPLAYLTTQFFEIPLRRTSIASHRQAARVIFAGVFVSIIFSVTGHNAPMLARKTYPKKLKMIADLLAERTGDRDGIAKELSCALNIENVHKGLCTELAGSADAKEILVIGNSFAWALFPMVASFAKEQGWSSTLYFAPGALFVESDEKFRMTQGFDTEKRIQFGHEIAADVDNAHKKTALAKTAAIFIYRITPAITATTLDGRSDYLKLDKDQTRNGSALVFRNSIILSVQSLLRAGVSKIAFLRPTPEFRFPYDACVLLHPTENCEVSRALERQYNLRANQILDEVARRFPSSVRLIDPIPSLCGADRCSSVIETKDGVIPVVLDADNHPSVAVGHYLAQTLKKDLSWLTSD